MLVDCNYADGLRTKHLEDCAFKPLTALSRAQRGKKRIAEEKGQQAIEPVGGKQAAAAEEPQEKPKRKYVKSGRFVGKFNDYQKQKQARANQAEQPSGQKRNKRTAGKNH